MPRPPHKPTDKTRSEVSALCSFGIPHEEIGRYVGVDDKTLRKYYRKEIDTAKITAIAEVAKFAFRGASGAALSDGATFADCYRMAMFWLKTQGGFREKDSLEVISTEKPPTIIIERYVKPSGAD